MSLEDEVRSYHWFHSIDLGNGITTPGSKSLDHVRQEADIYFSRLDLRGKSVLDVGAWNGGFSLEAARRGASRVAGLDHYTWNHPVLRGQETYKIVARATNNYFEMINVDLDAPSLSLSQFGQFDVVLFAGVFYHLVDPIAATREVAALAREVLILETYIEPTAEQRPAMVFYPGSELNNDPTNWWAPNMACIHALLTHFGFSRIETSPAFHENRAVFHAYRDLPIAV